MAVKAGQVVINVTAGTSQFVVDMEKAKGTIRSFGSAGVSETKAVTAGIKAMEGGFANNNKAAAAFIKTILGAGPIMSAMFPLVGGLAFGGMLVEIGKKATDFYKSVSEGAQKVGNAFRDLNAPLRMTNDELRIANDRLTNDIAKLEGKHQNTIQLALDEARKSADSLADSLGHALANLDKLLKENKVGFWNNLFGEASTSGLEKIANTLQQSVAVVTDQFLSVPG